MRILLRIVKNKRIFPGGFFFRRNGMPVQIIRDHHQKLFAFALGKMYDTGQDIS